MEKIHIIRQRNLLRIKREFQSQNELAERIGRSPGFISQRLKSVTIGENTARFIEKQLGKPIGWMDEDRDRVQSTEPIPETIPEPEQPKIDNATSVIDDRMHMIFEATRAAIRDSGQHLTQEQIIDIYKQAIDIGMKAVLTEEQLSVVLRILFKK